MVRYVKSIKTSKLVLMLGEYVTLNIGESDFVEGKLIFGSSDPWKGDEGVYGVVVGEKGFPSGTTGWHVVDSVGDAYRFYKNSILSNLDIDPLNREICVDGPVESVGTYRGFLGDKI